eukprot:6476799-Amphidinium_carterae.2
MMSFPDAAAAAVFTGAQTELLQQVAAEALTPIRAERDAIGAEVERLRSQLVAVPAHAATDGGRVAHDGPSTSWTHLPAGSP